MKLLVSLSAYYVFLATLCQAGLIAVNSTENVSSSGESSISGRIFGGQTVFQQDRYWYVARLQIYHSIFSSTICSGVVLTTNIVLTVAQCVSRPGGPKAQSVVVTLPRGGSYTFSRNEIFIPSSFIPGFYRGNVAILKKDTMSPEFIRILGSLPVLPPNPPPDYWNQDAIVLGWGRSDNNDGAQYTRLQYAVVRISGNACSKYGLVNGTMTADERLYCTYMNIAGTCDGDWGGPLLVTNSHLRAVIIGLSATRMGRECDGSSDMGSAYFSLRAPMIEWICSYGAC